METKKIYWAVFAGMLLSGLPAFAAEGARAVSAGFNVLPIMDMILRAAVPAILIFVFLSGIISPVIGYRWYEKHGGKKNWMRFFVWLPMLLAALLVGTWLLDPGSSSPMAEKAFPLAIILLAAAGVVAPVAAYRKYNHNKDKKWLIWLSYYPLLAVAAAIFGYALKYFSK